MGLRMNGVIVCAIVAALVFATAAAGAPEPLYSTNDQCLGCHAVGSGHGSTDVEFSGATVDYGKCATCHNQPDHFRHGYGIQTTQLTCAESPECHEGLPGAFYFADTFTKYGYFDSPASLSTSPSRLHDIHVDRTARFTYPKLISTSCVECHHSMYCTSCHTSEPPHKEHTFDADAGTYRYPASTYTVSTGWYTTTVSSLCTNPSCHTLSEAGTAAWKPRCLECHPERTYRHGRSTGNK